MVKLELANDYAIPDNFTVGGWVYVLGNEHFARDVYKIGMTTRTPEERVKELSTTGVPSEFDILDAYYSFNPSEDESLIHGLLSDYRINDNREFFLCSLNIINDAFEELGLVRRNTNASLLSMNFDFLSILKTKDHSDRIIYENLDVFGDINNVKNFLVTYAINDIRRNFSSNRLSIVVGDGSPKLIKNLDFDETKTQEIADLIKSKFPEKINRCAEF